MPDPGNVTRLLEAAGSGDTEAFDRLVTTVYDELCRIAHRQLAEERPDHTLDTAALVHEAYLKLVNLDRIQWWGRSHFFGAAAGSMRRILVDHALARRAQKRGGGASPVTLERVDLPSHDTLDDVLELNRALERLATLDGRQVRVVECRFFAGMTIEETAEALGVSPMTVKRDWTAARAWLNRELAG